MTPAANAATPAAQGTPGAPGTPGGRPHRTLHWQRTRRFTGWMLVLWFGVTFGVAWFARDLSFSVFGWPLSFWVGAQGAMLVYLAIIGAYARFMRRLDDEFGAGDGEG